MRQPAYKKTPKSLYDNGMFNGLEGNNTKRTPLRTSSFSQTKLITLLTAFKLFSCMVYEYEIMNLYYSVVFSLEKLDPDL